MPSRSEKPCQCERLARHQARASILGGLLAAHASGGLFESEAADLSVDELTELIRTAETYEAELFAAVED